MTSVSVDADGCNSALLKPQRSTLVALVLCHGMNVDALAVLPPEWVSPSQAQKLFGNCDVSELKQVFGEKNKRAVLRKAEAKANIRQAVAWSPNRFVMERKGR